MSKTSLLRVQNASETSNDVENVSKAKDRMAPKTIRDEFAMASLEHATGVYAKMTVAELDRMMGRKTYTKDQAVARLAYNMADAMLEARKV